MSWLIRRSPFGENLPVYWLFGNRLGILIGKRHLGFRTAIHLYPLGWGRGYIKLWPMRFKLLP